MWLRLYAALLALVVVWLFVMLRFTAWLAIVAFYACHYFVCVYNSSQSRSWAWLRGLSIWDRLHRGHMGGTVWSEGKHWADYETKGPCIFAVQRTPYGLVAVLLTFGLHGQQPKQVRDMAPLIVLPDRLFAYPLLANVLQWLGGVPYDKVSSTCARVCLVLSNLCT